MKSLFIAPLPPPMSGNALPVKVLYEEFKKNSNVTVINLSKSTHGSGEISIVRINKMLHIFREIYRVRKHYDIIYLTMAESFLGNLRDIIIYLICGTELNRVVIHMFGGAGIGKVLSNQKGIQYWVNKFFISRLGGIIVEGETQFKAFSNVTSETKIHVVNNFAEEYLFTTKAQIIRNFSQDGPLRILFLSNMLYGKGHFELLEAYFALDHASREKISIDFAGKLVSEEDKALFFSKIQNIPNIKYHGPVFGSEKKKLYSNAHIFCLPTYYPYEGQPFCIIEAYATGCAVITTNHSGIGDIFKDNVNGYEVKKQSIDSLISAIKKSLQDRTALSLIATNNLMVAKEKYTQSRYIEMIKSIFHSVGKS